MSWPQLTGTAAAWKGGHQGATTILAAHPEWHAGDSGATVDTSARPPTDVRAAYPPAPVNPARSVPGEADILLPLAGRFGLLAPTSRENNALTRERCAIIARRARRVQSVVQPLAWHYTPIALNGPLSPGAASRWPTSRRASVRAVPLPATERRRRAFPGRATQSTVPRRLWSSMRLSSQPQCR